MCGVVAVFLCMTSSVFGAETHLSKGGFGPDGTSATQFQHPAAVAVDQSTGNVYVGDAFPDETVKKFKVTLEPEPFTGISPAISNGALSGFGIINLPGQLAVDASSGDLYVVGDSESVQAFEPDGEPFEFTAGPYEKTHALGGSEVCGTAVDSNGDIYVSEYDAGISVYAHDGELLTTIPGLLGICNLAVGPEGVVYADMLESPVAGSSGPVLKLAPSPFPVTKATTYSIEGPVDADPSYAVATDPATGDLYVDEGNQIAEYDKNGVPLGDFGADVVTGVGRDGAGVAVNGASGTIYVAQGNFEEQVHVFGPALLLPDVATGTATEISPKGTATLNGTVNPDGVNVTGCRFDYGETEAYGHSAACEQVVGSGASEVAVTAKLAGLEPGVTYHFRLRASNEAAEAKGAVNAGGDQTVTMPPKPTISAAGASDLTATSADLSAEVDPGGLVTSCRFEYGRTIEYGKSLPCEPVSLEGSRGVLVQGHLEGLEPDVPYHWRVTAANEAGTTAGADHTFIYDTSGEGLPDNRSYEMVTPPQKNAAVIGDVLPGLSPAISEGGTRLIVSTVQCFGDARSCQGNREYTGTPYLFLRTGAGWVSQSLAPPANEFEANTAWLTSAAEGMVLFSMPTAPMFEDDFYRGPVNSSYTDIGWPTPPADGAVGLPWKGKTMVATGNFSRVAFQEEPIWPSFDNSVGKTSVYELCSERCQFGSPTPVLVGVSDEGQGDDLISRCETELGIGGDNPGMMSADGETVFFTASACPEGTGSNSGVEHSLPVNELFARVDGVQADAHTVAISEPSALTPTSAPYAGCRLQACMANVNNKENWRAATMIGASSDGSRVFFLSDQQLTDDAQAEPGGEGNLYMYDFTKPVKEEGKLPASGLIDLSAGDKSSLGPRVEGVMAISADGSHVYFVAQGVLTASANATGEVAQEGANNLYVWSDGDERNPNGGVAFITSLPEADGPQWRKDDDPALANVTPDGNDLVFESHGALTPDDTRTDGGAQIFRYDAPTGQLARISIGERGFNDDGNAGSGNAAIAKPLGSAGPQRLDPTMSHDGSFVFFESPIGLTPHALNDVPIGGSPGEPYAKNVYEWHEGSVHLISDGRDVAAAGPNNLSAVSLVGSDATGENVFFTTADSLVPEDTDTQIDYYDARICRTESPCVSSPPAALPPCLGEECHGIPVEALHAPAGGSATLTGTGNVRSAKKTVKEAKKRKRKKASTRCARGRPHKRRHCAHRRSMRGREEGMR